MIPDERLRDLYAERAALAFDAEHAAVTLVRDRALRSYAALHEDLTAKAQDWAAAYWRLQREQLPTPPDGV